MIPVLYKNMADASNGRWGIFLADLISCETHEERNGNFTLEAVLPAASPSYPSVDIGRYIYAECRDKTLTIKTTGQTDYTVSRGQFFHIYYVGRPINGRVTIKAEHLAAKIAKGTIMLPQAQAVSKFSNLATLDPYGSYNTKSIDMPVRYSTITSFFPAHTLPLSLWDYMAGTEGSIVDKHPGCEYLYDSFAPDASSSSAIVARILAINGRGADSGYEVRYGVNMTDFLHESDMSSTIRGVLPFWYNEQSKTYVAPSEPCMVSDAAPVAKIVLLDLSGDYQSAPTAAQLTSRGNAYLAHNDNTTPRISIKVDFVPLYNAVAAGKTLPADVAAWYKAKSLDLCDTVGIYHDGLGITARAKVVKQTYDVLRDRVTAIEVGNAKPSLPKTLSSVLKKTGVKIR